MSYQAVVDNDKVFIAKYLKHPDPGVATDTSDSPDADQDQEPPKMFVRLFIAHDQFKHVAISEATNDDGASNRIVDLAGSFDARRLGPLEVIRAHYHTVIGFADVADEQQPVLATYIITLDNYTIPFPFTDDSIAEAIPGLTLQYMAGSGGSYDGTFIDGQLQQGYINNHIRNNQIMFRSVAPRF